MMISRNPTGLVETLIPGWGQSRLSVSACVLGSDFSRREDFILISCIHQGKTCVCNGGEEPTALSLSPQRVTSHSGNPGCSAGWGCGQSGPRAMDNPSPRASPCAMAKVRELRESLGPTSPPLIILGKKLVTCPCSSARDFSFPSIKRESDA